MVDVERGRKEYWDGRFLAGDTPWELNAPSVVLREALSVAFPAVAAGTQRPLEGVTALSPGCGTGSDALELARQGARVLAVDWSEYACARLRERLADPGAQSGPGSISVLHGDFFAARAEPVDIICEHTFFCAIEPSARREYVSAVQRWLKPGGYLLGNFFVLSEVEARALPALSLTKEGVGPPFATTERELRALFSGSFEVVALYPAEKGQEGRRPGMEWVGVFAHTHNHIHGVRDYR